LRYVIIPGNPANFHTNGTNLYFDNLDFACILSFRSIEDLHSPSLFVVKFHR
jgi:hypothetical protein